MLSGSSRETRPCHTYYASSHDEEPAHGTRIPYPAIDGRLSLDLQPLGAGPTLPCPSATTSSPAGRHGWAAICRCSSSNSAASASRRTVSPSSCPPPSSPASSVSRSGTLRRHLTDERLIPFVQRQHQWRYDPSVGHGVQAHQPLYRGARRPAHRGRRAVGRGAGPRHGPPSTRRRAIRPPRLARNGHERCGRQATGSRNPESGGSRPLPLATKKHRQRADIPHLPPLPANLTGRQCQPVKLTTLAPRPGWRNRRPAMSRSNWPTRFDESDSIEKSIVSHAQQATSAQQRKRGPVDLLTERPDWREQVEYAEGVLGETGASRGFYVKVLRTLEAQDAMNIWGPRARPRPRAGRRQHPPVARCPVQHPRPPPRCRSRSGTMIISVCRVVGRACRLMHAAISWRLRQTDVTGGWGRR